jgi:hypothetical protein
MIAAIVPNILFGKGIKLKNIFAITIKRISPKINSKIPIIFHHLSSIETV